MDSVLISMSICGQFLVAYDVRSGHQMSPTGRSYSNSGYNSNPYGTYTTMPHSGSDYAQGKTTSTILLSHVNVVMLLMHAQLPLCTPQFSCYTHSEFLYFWSMPATWVSMSMCRRYGRSGWTQWICCCLLICVVAAIIKHEQFESNMWYMTQFPRPKEVASPSNNSLSSLSSHEVSISQTLRSIVSSVLGDWGYCRNTGYHTSWCQSKYYLTEKWSPLHRFSERQSALPLATVSWYTALLCLNLIAFPWCVRLML